MIESEEGPGYGGAILAAVGCGEFASVEEAAQKLVKVVDTVESDAELAAKYEERYQKIQKDLSGGERAVPGTGVRKGLKQKIFRQAQSRRDLHIIQYCRTDVQKGNRVMPRPK